MNLTQILSRVRDRIDESVANVWTDAELVRYLNDAIFDLTRKQAAVDESYHNHRFTIAPELAETEARDALVYSLPFWCHRVTSLWPAASYREGNPIAARTMMNRSGQFWAWCGHNRVLVVGNDDTSGITIECSKVPARLTLGTLTTGTAPATSQSEFYIRHSTNLYEMEHEKNAYANALFEFTGVNSSGHLIQGQRARCSSSESIIDGSGLISTKIRVQPQLQVTPAANDTFAMMPEIQPVHIDLLVLLTAKRAFAKKTLRDAIAVLMPDLQREYASFLNSITPRQDQQMPFVGMDSDPGTGSTDQDAAGGEL